MRDGVRDIQLSRRSIHERLGLMASVATSGRTIRTDDYVGECVRRGLEPAQADEALPHWIGVPMLAGSQVVGVLVLRSGDRSFSEADERVLTNIAGLAALALRSARLYQDRTRAYEDLALAQDQLVRNENLRALGEMASGVAHDFNNLLAAILGRAQLLLRRVADPTARQWLQIIERSATDGAKTVRRLQDVELREYSYAAGQITAHPDAQVTRVKALFGEGGMLELKHHDVLKTLHDAMADPNYDRATLTSAMHDGLCPLGRDCPAMSNSKTAPVTPPAQDVDWLNAYLIQTQKVGVGANMAYRREVFEQIGTFDTALDVGTPAAGAGVVPASISIAIRNGLLPSRKRSSSSCPMCIW
jgi:hypothetical protein